MNKQVELIEKNIQSQIDKLIKDGKTPSTVYLSKTLFGILNRFYTCIPGSYITHVKHLFIIIKGRKTLVK